MFFFNWIFENNRPQGCGFSTSFLPQGSGSSTSIVPRGGHSPFQKIPQGFSWGGWSDLKLTYITDTSLFYLRYILLEGFSLYDDKTRFTALLRKVNIKQTDAMANKQISIQKDSQGQLNSLDDLSTNAHNRHGQIVAQCKAISVPQLSNFCSTIKQFCSAFKQFLFYI